MVQISVFTTPRVRLHFPDTHALCHSFTEEFIRLSEMGSNNTPGFNMDAHIEKSLNGAIAILRLPLEAQVEIPSNGKMVITLDINALLKSTTPSTSYH